MRLLKIHSIEPETTGPRTARVSELVIHTTDTGALRRYSTDKAWNLRRIEAAIEFHGITRETADRLRALYADGRPMSDAAALCLIAASNPRRASWHYAVASMPEPGQSEAEVVEFVPPVMQAHHVGPIGGATNNRSVGIECLAPGAIPKTYSQADATEWFRAKGWAPPKLLAGPDGVRRWYTPQDETQYQALLELGRNLRVQFPGIRRVEGHHKYAPSRRIDPDPPVSLVRLRADLFANFVGPTTATASAQARVPGGVRLV